MWQGMNQRQFPRVKYRCVVKVAPEGKASSAISAVTENIGLGGVCLLLEKGLGIFSPVELELDLKDSGPPLRLEGTVVWVVRRRELRKGTTYDTGVEFSELSPRDKSRIEAVVDRAGSEA